MATTFQIKRSSVPGKKPDVGDLSVGELAVNLNDGILYSKNTANYLVVVGSSTTSNVTEGANLYFTDARVNTALSSQTLTNATFSGEVIASTLRSSQSSGDEGGELDLAAPEANTTINGRIAIDVYQNKLRIFETTGTNRGAFIDFSAAGSGVSSNLLAGGGVGGDVNSVNGETGTVVLTTANIAEQSNLYFTNERVYANVELIGYASNSYVNTRLETKANVSDLSTGNVIEGTNLYFTNARVYANIVTTFGAVANTYVNTRLETKANVSDLNTSNISEGTNLYFTNSRSVGALTAGTGIVVESNGLILSTVTGDVVSVNGETGTVILTTANIAEQSNLYYTDARVYANVELIGYASNVYVNDRLETKANVSDLTTANVSEVTNLYFTQERARESLSQGSGITFIQSTGVITANVITVAGQVGDISNTQLIDAIKTVDGHGSNLDSDFLDGLQGGGNGAYALKANNLSVFASTTSAELAGVISDETGSGSLVFATSPTLDGTPQAPTAEIGTANTMIATTEFASNASYLASGIVNPSRIAGSYTGITGVGTIDTGVWNGSSISTTYTDAKVVSVNGEDGTVVLTTANINEQTNLYFSNARSYANIVVEYGAAANIYVNTRLETKANVSDLTTANVSEVTNLYFTNTRARDSLTSGTGVSYNAGTGTISIGQSVGTNDSVTFANVTVTGNLLVQGNTVTFSSNTFLIQDPLIQVGVNPIDDTVDLGFFGHYNDGTVERHAGLFRDATDGQFKLFSNLFPEPSTIVATGDSSYRNANLVVNFIVGKVTDISNHSTTNLTEGTNLYFTNTRAIGAFTGGSGITVASNGLLTVSVEGGVTSVAGQTGAISNAQLLAAVSAVDGVGSGLDADVLDGLAGGGAGFYALKANNLSVFASTTSAQLAGVISDETGTGNLVFNASPTFTGTPQVPTAAASTSNNMIASTAFAASASNLTSGTVPTDRISGSYTGITGVGTITAGTWQGSSISTTYTDAKITSVAGQTGAISNSQLLSAISAVDGVGSGLDADTLDGLAGGGAGFYALKANNLSVFASTTSAQLAGVISDETGSGNLVFNASPTFTGTPQAPTATIGTANTMIATTAFAANASALTSGVINPARVVGSYTNITGVGTIAAGTWQGSSISTTYTAAKITSITATSPIAANAATGAVALSHTNSGVVAGTYGNATIIPVITVNATGHVTSVSNVAITATGGGSSVTVATTPPSGASEGDLYWDEEIGSLFIYYNDGSSSQWIDASPATLPSITNNTTSTSTFYPTLSSSTTGGLQQFTVSSTKLSFVPSTGVLSATEFNSLSDITFKHNISSINDSYNILNKINPVEFKWKDTNKKSYGVIAQDIEKFLPELVSTNEEGIKSVSYIPIISVLVSCVKELREEIQQLKKMIN